MHTVGSLLRRVREDSGLTIQQLAATTRIPARTIEAIEEDRVEDLPAPVYTRGFVRTLCAELGIDSAEVLPLLDLARPGPVEPLGERASMLVLSAEGADAVPSSRGFQVTHAVLLAIAVLTFLAAVLTSAVRGEHPGAQAAAGATNDATAAIAAPSAAQTLSRAGVRSQP